MGKEGSNQDINYGMVMEAYIAPRGVDCPARGALCKASSASVCAVFVNGHEVRGWEGGGRGTA